MSEDLFEEECCPNCRHPLDEDEDFCPNCGALIKHDDEFGGFQDEDSLDEDF